MMISKILIRNWGIFSVRPQKLVSVHKYQIRMRKNSYMISMLVLRKQNLFCHGNYKVFFLSRVSVCLGKLIRGTKKKKQSMRFKVVGLVHSRPSAICSLQFSTLIVVHLYRTKFKVFISWMHQLTTVNQQCPYNPKINLAT